MEELKKKKLYNDIFRVVMVLITCSIFYSLGFLVGQNGWEIGISSSHKGVFNISKGQAKNADFSNFWRVWDTVQQTYAGKIDNQKMVSGAISGMIGSLNDPYTVYLPADLNNQFQEDISGHFEGVGIEVTMKDNKVTVVAPVDGSPAEKAGILAKDVVSAIDGKSTDGMPIDDVVNKIRGKSGTTVTLSILRNDATTPVDYKLVRGTVYVKSVKWQMKDNNIAYVEVTQFGEDTYDLFNQTIDEINAKKPKAVIIDLRNNPGGLLDTAVDITSLLVKPGVVVQRKYKDGHIEKDKTNSKIKPKMLNTKLYVLVNGGSASACEIFAGVIQDTKRGTVIGEKTFGKGSVQDLTPLSNGASIKVTIAKWLTPNGRQIDGKGLEPDIKVSGTIGEDGQADPQLDRAMLEALK